MVACNFYVAGAARAARSLYGGRISGRCAGPKVTLHLAGSALADAGVRPSSGRGCDSEKRGLGRCGGVVSCDQ